MSDETWQPVDTLAEIEGEWEFVYSAETPHERSRLTDVKLPNGYAVCKRVEPEAITPLALEREPGWEYMQWNGVTDEWDKQFSPPIMGHSNCVGVRFRERKSVPPDEPTVYIFLSNSYVHATGVKTMADLRTLVKFLGGAE